jgi:transposase InsO family protein
VKKAENNKNKKRIREFFSDNRPEYTNKYFQKALNNYGIIHNTTPIYTKEPNSLIERINLTLLSKVRSLLIMVNTPRYLWGEALLASVYLYNRTPYSSLGYKTPYKIFYKEKPYIQNIRSWGSITYYHSNMSTNKLSPRKEKAILISYS